MSNLKKQRSCDGCTECCRGWLTGHAHGKLFYPGKPCHFVGEKACTIYKDRPQEPCKTFRCVWLDDPDGFPEWLKPSLSKVLITKAVTKNSRMEYLSVNECGKIIDSKCLMYLVLYAINNSVNIAIQIEGGWNYLGRGEFVAEMNAP